MKTAVKRSFEIDGSLQQSGYTFGQTWNGFQCPYFEFKEALSFANLVNSDGYSFTYDKESNSFTESYDGENFTLNAITIETENGEKQVFDFGQLGWVFDYSDNN